MSKCHTFSRREFLKMVGLAASAATLGACTPQTPTTVAPTATPESAMEEVKPIAPEMVLVEAGSFQMGSTDGHPAEQPVHTVHITRPFYMGRYAVTFEEYDRFCDDTIGIRRPKDKWGRGTRPVSGVDWHDAVTYCNWLSEKEGLTPCYSGKGKLIQCDFSANGYRLPTEAEWEYAARGGPRSQGYKYAGSNNVDDVGWYDGNSGGQTHPVGQKQPNELGLYDMSGNTWEWCWDWYDKDYYASSPASDPTGPSSGTGPYIADAERARRSGSHKENSGTLRVAYRSADGANYPGDNGFRLVRTK